MWRNRILYLTALAAVTVFYGFFYAWFSEFLWYLVLMLPVLSLVMSLPAMLLMKPSLDMPLLAEQGQSALLKGTTLCLLPQSRCRFRLIIESRLTGCAQSVKMRPNGLVFTRDLPTEHCGTLVCSFRRVWVCDYLGLFAIPRKWNQQAAVTVIPRFAAPDQLPSVLQLLSASSRPKPGGGFSETYELRDYRPGDSLRQVHWKLTAKNDSPIVREPQEPDQGPIVLTLDLAGTPDEMDLTMGKTLYLSRWLLEQDFAHRVQWLTVEGIRSVEMGNPDHLPDLARALAESTPTPPGTSSLDTLRAASWHYHVLPDA